MRHVNVKDLDDTRRLVAFIISEISHRAWRGKALVDTDFWLDASLALQLLPYRPRESLATLARLAQEILSNPRGRL